METRPLHVSHALLVSLLPQEQPRALPVLPAQLMRTKMLLLPVRLAVQGHMQLLAQRRAQTALVGRRTWTQTRLPRVTRAVQARTQSLGLQLATTA